jgi:hypothetical protein
MKCSVPQISLIEICDDDDPGFRVFADQVPCRPDAIHLSHLNVHQNKIRPVQFVRCYSFRTIASFVHFAVNFGKKGLEKAARGSVVIDDQELQWLRIFHRDWNVAKV